MQPHFSKGSSDTYAFVFSCPGKHEEDAGYPAAGKTGRNLQELLTLLAFRLGHETLERDSVTIANTWATMEYQGGTRRRSEATDSEIQDGANISRLAGELRHVTRMVVFCGRKAEVAARELVRLNFITQPTKIAFVKHLGARGLLSIRCDLHGELIVAAKEQRRSGRDTPLKQVQAENTHRRLEVVAQRLLDSVQTVP